MRNENAIDGVFCESLIFVNDSDFFHIDARNNCISVKKWLEIWEFIVRESKTNNVSKSIH